MSMLVLVTSSEFGGLLNIYSKITHFSLFTNYKFKHPLLSLFLSLSLSPLPLPLPLPLPPSLPISLSTPPPTCITLLLNSIQQTFLSLNSDPTHKGSLRYLQPWPPSAVGSGHPQWSVQPPFIVPTDHYSTTANTCTYTGTPNGPPTLC